MRFYFFRLGEGSDESAWISGRLHCDVQINWSNLTYSFTEPLAPRAHVVQKPQTLEMMESVVMRLSASGAGDPASHGARERQ